MKDKGGLEPASFDGMNIIVSPQNTTAPRIKSSAQTIRQERVTLGLEPRI